MKKTNLFAIMMVAMAIIMSACDGKKIEKMQHDIDSLQSLTEMKDGDLRDMANFLTVISEGLDSIAQQEDMLFTNGNGPEGQVVDREQIRKNLSDFEETLKRQKNRIAQLESDLKKKGANVTKLQGIIDMLNRQLEEKDAMITQLKADLEQSNFTVAQLRTHVDNLNETNAALNRTVEEQNQAISQQSEQLNEAYVRIGTKKELENDGLLSGGFMKKKKLDMQNIQQGHFQRIDIRNTSEIGIDGRKPKLLTQAPANSYTFVDNGNGTSTLRILDRNQFWSLSKYLVIQIK